MYIVLALAATALTSWLPICTKLLVRDARPALVAWAINAASLPLLAAGTLLLTVGALPRVDAVFALALLVAAALNGAATLAATYALAHADAALVTPLLTFNPAFTLLVAAVVLGERPVARQLLGVAVILLGAYLLDATPHNLFGAVRLLLRRPGTLLALGASAAWGVTTVLEKIAIRHATPPSGPFVALVSTALTVLLLTPGALPHHGRQTTTAARAATPDRLSHLGGLSRHPRALAIAILLAGVAPLFGFSAIAAGEVGLVTALFKLSAVLTILWARLLLGEGQVRQRLLGAVVMLAGGALIAL